MFVEDLNVITHGYSFQENLMIHGHDTYARDLKDSFTPATVVIKNPAALGFRKGSPTLSVSLFKQFDAVSVSVLGADGASEVTLASAKISDIVDETTLQAASYSLNRYFSSIDTASPSQLDELSRLRASALDKLTEQVNKNFLSQVDGVLKEPEQVRNFSALVRAANFVSTFY